MFSTIVIDWASSDIGVEFSHRWSRTGGRHRCQRPLEWFLIAIWTLMQGSLIC